MFELILIGIFTIIIAVVIRKNLELEEKIAQLEFDKIMRGITSDLENNKSEDSFSDSIYKQRTIQ